MTDATDVPASEHTADDPATPPRDRTMSWWPLAAAAVVAAVFLTIIFVVGSDGDEGPGTRRDSGGALKCPSHYRQTANSAFWVPADPSGVDATKSLVPDTAPSNVTVCAYRSTEPDKEGLVRLSGGHTLTSGLRSLTRDLSALPKATKDSSSLTSGPDHNFLIGFTFATGFVWVSVPALDAGASNGRFVTNRRIHHRVANAYSSRAWK